MKVKDLDKILEESINDNYCVLNELKYQQKNLDYHIK